MKKIFAHPTLENVNTSIGITGESSFPYIIHPKAFSFFLKYWTLLASWLIRLFPSLPCFLPIIIDIDVMIVWETGGAIDIA